MTAFGTKQIIQQLNSYIMVMNPNMKSFNTVNLYILPTQGIYVFCVDIRTNSDFLPMQH